MFFKPKTPKLRGDRPGTPEPRNRQRRVNSDGRQIPAIFSYHARRNDNYVVSVDHDDQMQPRDRQNQVAKLTETAKLSTTQTIFLYLGLMVVFGFVCYELVLTKPPTVVVSGGTSAAVANANMLVYQKNLEAQFNQSLSNRSKLTINAGKVDSQLQKAFPELESVTTTIPVLGKSVIVHVVPAKAVLADVLTDGTTVAIDKRGVDISAALSSGAEASLPKVIDQSGTRANPGHAVLPSSLVSFITTVEYQLHSQGVTTVSMTLPSGGSELDVTLEGVGYIAKFNLQQDARVQAGTLAATLKSLATQHVVPSKYIDVRLPGRAYYL